MIEATLSVIKNTWKNYYFYLKMKVEKIHCKRSRNRNENSKDSLGERINGYMRVEYKNGIHLPKYVHVFFLS